MDPAELEELRDDMLAFLRRTARDPRVEEALRRFDAQRSTYECSLDGLEDRLPVRVGLPR